MLNMTTLRETTQASPRVFGTFRGKYGSLTSNSRRPKLWITGRNQLGTTDKIPPVGEAKLGI